MNIYRFSLYAYRLSSYYTWHERLEKLEDAQQFFHDDLSIENKGLLLIIFVNTDSGAYERLEISKHSSHLNGDKGPIPTDVQI